ncbi:hypothetical protein LCGC14_2140470 [marine sediment metagenome]|uniref:Uncharacterized protein n=1 Tax=marine sediment metagenome TaxID=412755 RepID=A0A0F9DYG9_9ZZZZ
MTNFKAILDTVPSLDLVQLRKLKGAVGALLSLNGEGGKPKESTYPAPRSNGSGSDLQLALDVIRDELKGLGIPTRTYGTPKLSYCSKIEETWKFLDEKIPNLQRIERRALFHTCIRCLIRVLKKQQLPISETMVLKHLHRFPQALEYGFPGYLESGMLGKVVRREMRHVRTKPDRQAVP